MTLIGLIISFLLGLSLMNLISWKFSILEKLSLSFLVGSGVISVLMLILDLFNIPLTIFSIWSISIITIVLLNIKSIIHRKEIVLSFPPISKESLPKLNLVWLVFIGLIIYLEYMNITKCMYFPAFDSDSIAGFDTIGYIVAKEHTFANISVFNSQYVAEIHNPGSYMTYPPLLQLNYAYLYLLGAETSKLFPALVYLSLLVSFYSVVARFVNHTLAAVTTFFMMITPEMIAFSSLSGTNVVHATYVSLGILYAVLALQKKEKSYLYLSATLLSLNMLVRSEGIVFIGATMTVIFIYTFFTRDQNISLFKNYRSLIWFTIISASGFVFWQIFMKISGFWAEGIVVTHLFWDSERASNVLNYSYDLWANKVYYGITFGVFCIAIISNIYFICRKRDSWFLPAIIILSMFFYMILMYQLKYNWASIEAVFTQSVKRFMFCFIPLIWCSISSSYIVRWCFNKLDEKLALW